MVTNYTVPPSDPKDEVIIVAQPEQKSVEEKENQVNEIPDSSSESIQEGTIDIEFKEEESNTKENG